MAKDDAFLKLARDRFKLAEDADKPQRERELADLRFYAGEQWDSDILKSRQGTTIGSGTTQQVVPARPSLTINKTREPVRQVLNQERQSDMGIELIPADDFGEMAGPIDHTEIELREGLVRRIQRDSEAADARTWAFSRAAIAGRGYWRVNTRYVPKSWDQEIYIERIYNQAAVLLDPAHQQPDGSDAAWGFIGADLPIATYRAKYPDHPDAPNRISGGMNDQEWRALGDEAPGWFTGEGETRNVRVVTYYYVEIKSRELLQLADGSSKYRDELPKDYPKEQIIDSRPDEDKQWYWGDLDGVQKLAGDKWQGHYMPIIKVLGEELQPYDKERRCEGIVRPMRDPCMGNNYIVSKFVERVGLTPISPWMMADGQDQNFEAEYDAANTRALSRLHYNVVDSFGKPVPPPFRVDAKSEIADIAMGVQIFGQAIVSTSVVPETALGNVDPSVKSGKLAKALIEQGERGTSNFLDNLKRSMRHEARVENDLLYPIYGTRPGRLARMMNDKGEMDAVVIGQPFTVQGQGRQAKPQPINVPQGQPIPEGAKLYQLTPDAEFNVAVKISKNEGTRREQQRAMVGEMMAAVPELTRVIGDLFFKYDDGPGHLEMEQRMKMFLMPEVQSQLNGGQKPPLPPEVEQQMAMMQQQMQELQQLADKNIADLKKTELTKQADERIAEMDNATKIKIAGIQAESSVAKEELKAGMDDFATRIAHVEALIGHAHEVEMQTRDHAHEQEMAQQQHEQALQQNEQGQAHALEQGEQGQMNALEQGQQAADLAPPPQASA